MFAVQGCGMVLPPRGRETQNVGLLLNDTCQGIFIFYTKVMQFGLAPRCAFGGLHSGSHPLPPAQYLHLAAKLDAPDGLRRASWRVRRLSTGLLTPQTAFDGPPGA